MDTEQIGSALEAILFAAGDSVEMSRVAKILGVESWEVRRAAEKLRSEYEEGHRGIRLVRMEERFQLVTAPEHAEIVTRALEKRPPSRLSPTALEVLSIVAYYQPVTRAYIEQMRGADSSYTGAMLTERGLIAPCGRLEAPGRPVLFGTTEQFLRVMGLSSLQELPPLPNVATGEGIEALQEAIEAASGKERQLSIEGMD